ncbi:hypothetical protein ACKVWM_004621 [Pyricularia oryzae]
MASNSKSSKERRLSVMSFFSNRSNRLSAPSLPTSPLSSLDSCHSEDKENKEPSSQPSQPRDHQRQMQPMQHMPQQQQHRQHHQHQHQQQQQPPQQPSRPRLRPRPVSSVFLVPRDEEFDTSVSPKSFGRTDTSLSVPQGRPQVQELQQKDEYDALQDHIRRSHQRASTQPVLGETASTLTDSSGSISSFTTAASSPPVADKQRNFKRLSLTAWPPRQSSPTLKSFFSTRKTKSPATELPPPERTAPAIPSDQGPPTSRLSISRKPVPPHPRDDRSASPAHRKAQSHSEAPTSAGYLEFAAPKLPPPLAPAPKAGNAIPTHQNPDARRKHPDPHMMRNFSHKASKSLEPPPPPPPPPKDNSLAGGMTQRPSDSPPSSDIIAPRQRQTEPEAKGKQQKRLQPRPRQVSPSPEPQRGRRSVSAHPSPGSKIVKARTEGPQSTQASTPATSRPPSANSRAQSAHSGERKPVPGNSPSRGRLRKSWLPGGRGKEAYDNGPVAQGSNSAAWILSPEGRAEYGTSYLSNGEKVPELWNESGDVMVFLLPRDSGAGPSFRLPGGIFADSSVFDDLLRAEMTSSPAGTRDRINSFSGRDSLTAEDARRNVQKTPSPPPGGEGSGVLRLFLTETPTWPKPVHGPPPLERLIDIRNVFAFLTGQPLVATLENPSLFHVLLRIAGLLREFGFSSPDGMSFGRDVDLSMSFYTDQFGLADVKHSPEKTVQGLMVGEQMRSWELYNEAFVHAVGKWEAIMELKSPMFTQLTRTTRDRLERSHFDLESRRHNFCTRLDDMAFPGIFAGIANSTSNSDFRHVRFKNWKNSFISMRSFILKYYKHQFGSWPPKARSKKNPFTESGLNRQVLRTLYSDLCALYDLLVDREQMTTRMFNQATHDEPVDPAHAEIVALRKLLEEYDNSSPPVLPPIPFDVPKLPTMKTILETYDQLSAKEQAAVDRRVKSHELILVMRRSYNFDTDSLQHPFLDAFKQYDLAEAKGKSSSELSDFRFGCWIFLYVVIQALPMLAVDAPGVRFTEGAEYFLCMPPKGDPPWMEDGASVRKMWFKLVDQDKQVELSADAVLFSVEATYDRSHCWQAAKRWAEAAAAMDDAEGPDQVIMNQSQQMLPPLMSPLEPPRPGFSGMDADGSGSPTMGTGTPGSASPTASGMGSPMLRPRRQSPAGASTRNRVSGHWRSSIAFGLEPVDMDPAAGPPGATGSPYSGSNRSLLNLNSPATGEMESPSAPFAQSARTHVGRSYSAGNLQVVGNNGPPPSHPKDHSRHGSTVTGGDQGMSFDDILKGMEDTKIKKKKSWLPGA